MTSDLNPYAPPVDTQSLAAMQEDWAAGQVWRLGNLMVIGNEAELRPRCFLTGEDTDTSMEIKTSWLPGWVYLLILFGIFPYFVVAPFLRRDIRIKVPLSDRYIQSYRKQVRFTTLAGLLFIVGWVLFAAINEFGPQMTIRPIVLLVFAYAVAWWFVRIPPVRLNIVRADRHVLVLSDLPSNCLEGLPQFERAASK